MEKYQAPSDAGVEGGEEGADPAAALHLETAEALKDVLDAALQISGLQVKVTLLTSMMLTLTRASSQELFGVDKPTVIT